MATTPGAVIKASRTIWDWHRGQQSVGEAIGEEVAAKGGNVLLAPCINVLRHPLWGRAQETYGEDPHHLSRMGVAFIQGAQTHVIASVKHFALNSIEDVRFDVDVSVDERTLREIYLPHFKAAVQEARVGSVMSAYNLVNGHHCGENEALLGDILKGEWGFDGFVESDWIMGTRSTIPSALAGLDLEMPAPVFFGDSLRHAVEDGEVPESVIDEAVRRILRKKIEFGLFAPETVSPDVVESPEHTALAREVAERSIVLLKNAGGVLPLDPSDATTIAVVGSLADTINLGDRGSSLAVPSYAVTPLAGIRQLVGGAVTLVHVGADTLSPADATSVADASAAVVVVGLTNEDEGENMPNNGGDRETLALSAEHVALIQAVAALNPRTIVVLEGGSAITMEWVDGVPAVLMAWYPGMEGGAALAEILFGEVNPSGKLPITFPTDALELPAFTDDDESVTYDYYHGYLYVDREGYDPLFPFGFGLSYTTYSYDGIRLDADTLGPEDVLAVSVDVTNTGDRAGEEIVQLYVESPGSVVDRPARMLKAFGRIALAAGEASTLELRLPVRDLAYWDVGNGAWQVESLTYTARVGSSSRHLPLSAEFTVN